MGIDVEMMARSADPLTDEDVARLASEFDAEFGPADRYGYPSLGRERYEDDGGRIIRIDTLERLYSPTYARGDWPRIRSWGDWLMLRFGEAGEVRYGGDYASGWEELIPYADLRPDHEEHWNTRGHAPYRTACGCEHCASLSGSLADRP